MADGRIIHRKVGTGLRTCQLEHLEFRVWVQYELSADDCGVMRASASVLRADNPRLEQEPIKRIQAAIERLVEVELVSTFTHQGQRFIWQTDWQDFQGVRYPRASTNPLPPRDLWEKATVKTQRLFLLASASSPSHSGADSETSPHPARAGGRETLTPPLTPTLTPRGEESAREGDASARPGQNPHHKPTNLVNGAEQRRHGQHAWCDTERGLCVPYGLHDEFKKRAGKSDAELKAWYATTIQSVAGVAVGDGLYDFWKNHFAAWVGTVTRKPTHRRETPVESNLRGLREDLEVLDDHGTAIARKS